MMNGKFGLVSLALFSLAVLGSWSCGDAGTSDAMVLKIVATGSVGGEIEPCG
ncbi:MAG: hypothetical protein JSW54_00830 [Fidelibacterota bacterium]|nr:MAG: hypothetical protein JSW54_00830 [Candidatus Neomarinimicrobiota bacterium]